MSLCCIANDSLVPNQSLLQTMHRKFSPKVSSRWYRRTKPLLLAIAQALDKNIEGLHLVWSALYIDFKHTPSVGRIRSYTGATCMPFIAPGTEPQVVYGADYMIWKLGKNCEKRWISQKKGFCWNLLVGNLEKLAKNTQVHTICYINLKRNRETGNRQTDRQTDKVL